MKKIVSVVIALMLSVSLVACDEDKNAFEVSKAAYDNINAAYEITEQFASDVYEAWRLGIHEDESIVDKGVTHLAEELSLSEDELKDGLAYVIVTNDGDWETATEEDKDLWRESGSYFFEYMDNEGSLFGFCVDVVISAYKANGKVEEVQKALDLAKDQMKELSEDYSDYEHYPSLKGFYTTTKSYFEYCCKPTGSFEQMKETDNKYTNEARDYISDLDYIFED